MPGSGNRAGNGGLPLRKVLLGRQARHSACTAFFSSMRMGRTQGSPLPAMIRVRVLLGALRVEIDGPQSIVHRPPPIVILDTNSIQTAIFRFPPPRTPHHPKAEKPE